MTTSLRHLMVATLAAVCCVVATYGTTWADDKCAVAPVPAYLLQWHSGLTLTEASCVDQEHENLRGTSEADDFTAYVVMHGPAGRRDRAEGGLYYSFGSSMRPRAFAGPQEFQAAPSTD